MVRTYSRTWIRSRLDIGLVEIILCSRLHVFASPTQTSEDGLEVWHVHLELGIMHSRRVMFSDGELIENQQEHVVGESIQHRDVRTRCFD